MVGRGRSRTQHCPSLPVPEPNRVRPQRRWVSAFNSVNGAGVSGGNLYCVVHSARRLQIWSSVISSNKLWCCWRSTVSPDPVQITRQRNQDSFRGSTVGEARFSEGIV